VFDHEDILLERQKVHIRKVAPAFIDLIEAGLQSKPPLADAHNTRP
jgi:hypothetical protein